MRQIFLYDTSKHPNIGSVSYFILLFLYTSKDGCYEKTSSFSDSSLHLKMNIVRQVSKINFANPPLLTHFSRPISQVSFISISLSLSLSLFSFLTLTLFLFISHSLFNKILKPNQILFTLLNLHSKNFGNKG